MRIVGVVELVEQGLQFPLPPAKLQARLAIRVAVHSAKFPKYL
jgi:hypothetical protein